MAERFVVGDTVTLTNTFKVSGTATDPSTVSLVVTDPAGTATTYTYAGATITKSSTGVYTKNITASTAGLWAYTWTGTGTAADVESGTFEVHAVQPTTAGSTDVLTFLEAKRAVNLDTTNTDGSELLTTLITAVSTQLDELCGPVVNRTITTETHDGGSTMILLRYLPVSSITTVTEYSGTIATTLTAETNTTKTTSNYLHVGTTGRLASGRVVRRSNNCDATFAIGRRNIEVTYVAGRAATTAAVPAKFKQAAAMMLRNVWVSEQASGSETFGAFTDQAPNPLLGPGLLNKVVALLEGEMLPGVALL